MRCPKCGRENRDDAKFCVYCHSIFKHSSPTARNGKPIVKNGGMANKNSKLNKKASNKANNKVILIGVAAVLAVVLVATVLIIVASNLGGSSGFRRHSGGGGGSFISESYSVSFDLNYEGAENPPQTQFVEEGSRALQPDSPIREGYVFWGWYKDREGTVAFSFGSPVTENLVLYAKWGNGGNREAEQVAELDKIKEINGGELPEISMDEDNYIPASILGTYSEIAVKDYDTAKQSIKDISNIMLIADVDNEFVGVTNENIDGVNHYRLQQTLDGYDVYGKQLVVTADENGKITSLTGNYDPVRTILNHDRTVSVQTAYGTAVEENYNINGAEGEMVIYSVDTTTAEYAWMFNGEDTVFVSAASGEILEAYTNVFTQTTPTVSRGENVSGTTVAFNTKYDESSGLYTFHDTVRNVVYHDLNGVNSLQYDWYGLAAINPMTNRENVWSGNSTREAITLYENLSDVYDYYLEVLGLVSYDGNGGAVYAYVGDSSYNGYNAYNWGPVRTADGNVTILSFGNGANYNRDLGVVAHEFTHAVQRAAVGNLIYANETGALMEAYSDVGGELAQLYVTGRTDWMSSDRNIGDPQSGENPSSYRGLYYGNEVHLNSTVISHAIYKMYMDGINDPKELTELTYRAWNYLSPSASFIDYRMAMLAAAEDMGFNGAKLQHIRDAFDEVNVKPQDYSEHFYSTLTLNVEVLNAGTQERIPDALVRIINPLDGTYVGESMTDVNGRASIELRGGIYTVEVSAAGYNTNSSNMVFSDNMDVSISVSLESDSVQEELICEVGGKVTDATSAAPLSGVTLKFRKGYNVTTGGYIQIATDENGDYHIRDLDYGYYTIEAEKEGYITTYVIVQSAAVNWEEAERRDALSQNFSISPYLATDTTLRIVLSWGENPRDLDSHIEGKNSSGSSYHVYYRDKDAYNADGSTAALLDVDDTTSYGPETVTLNWDRDIEYEYYVHLYAGSGTISTSGAKVLIYSGSSLIHSIEVPEGSGYERYWNVFKFKNGNFEFANTFSSTPF